MKRFRLIPLLFAFCFCIFCNGTAETEIIRGKIEMNLPNAPTPTVEVNLDKKFFKLFINFTVNLPEYAEYAEMIDGVFIQGYAKESENLTEMTHHYQNILKTEKWEDIIRVKDKLRVSLLFADEPGIVHGIFISFTDKNNTSFVNIFGKLDFQKLGTLFGKLMESDSQFWKNLKSVYEVEVKDGPILAALPINYPNPFKDNTRISFTLARQSTVTIVIYDATLRPVRVLVDNEVWDAGEYTHKPDGSDAIGWDGKTSGGEDLAQGIYFCRITVADGFEPETAILKLALTR